MLNTFELHADDSSPATPEIAKNAPNTPSRVDTRPLPWFMSISLATRPRCFGCGGRMLPKVVIIQSDFALCQQCGRIDWSDYRPFWFALESLGSTLELTRSRGIVFWTPPPPLPDQDAYLRWMELWEANSGVSARKLIRRT